VKVELTVGPLEAEIYAEGGKVVVELESDLGWFRFALPPDKALELADALAKAAALAREEGGAPS
jgi:hypothetical protein